jgi:prepilin-type N-terminal cleavage/methylation domain-containing protein
MKREEGFTLVELLAVIAITSILLTLGVTALRFFWLGRALHGERDQIFTGLRTMQQQVVSETNPLVFGAWFKVTTPSTDNGAAQWGIVRYKPADTAAGTAATCTSTATHRLDGGVQIGSAEFADSLPGVASVADVVTLCKSSVPSSALATDFTFFLARGTATAGCVTLNQPRRDMDDVTVHVSGLTGRVERLDETEAAASCP